MSEILSKDELAALLGAMTEGPPVEIAPEAPDPQHRRRVKRYDFRRPYKLSNEQLRTLHMMHEVFGRQAQVTLSAHLRTPVECNVFMPEQMTYEEYAGRFSGPCVLVLFGLNPLQGRALLELSPTLALAMIDRLLGGPGRAPARPRTLTEIEQTVLGQLCGRVLQHLREGWHRVATVDPAFERIEQNAQVAQLLPPTEMVIVIPFELRFREVAGNLSICFPYVSIEPLVPKLTTQYFLVTAREAPDGSYAEALRQRMQSLKLPVAALLGSVQVTVSELLDLQVGDVIRLPCGPKDALPVRVGAKTKFTGKPGRVGKRLAVQIDTVAEEEAGPDV